MRVRKEAAITIAVILVVIIIAGSYTYLTSRNSKLNNDDTTTALDDFLGTTEDYSYTDIDGNRIKLEDFTGSILVVNSWATWSPASAIELKQLGAFSERYEDGTVKFLAINRADRPILAKKFLTKFEISDTILLVLDPEDRYYNLIDGYNMPETVVYSEEGEVLKHIRGKIDFNLLAKVVEDELLKDQVEVD